MTSTSASASPARNAGDELDQRHRRALGARQRLLLQADQSHRQVPAAEVLLKRGQLLLERLQLPRRGVAQAAELVDERTDQERQPGGQAQEHRRVDDADGR